MKDFKDNPTLALISAVLSAAISVYMYTKFATFDYVNEQIRITRTQLEKQQDEFKSNTKAEMKELKEDIKKELSDIKLGIKALERTTMDFYREIKFKEGFHEKKRKQPFD